MEQVPTLPPVADAGAPPGTRRLGGTHEPPTCRGAPSANALRPGTSPFLHRRSRFPMYVATFDTMYQNLHRSRMLRR